MPSRDYFKADSSPDPVVVGVDGCKGGWFAVSRTLSENGVAARVFSRFEEILDAWKPAVIAVDIPIGLSSDWHYRGCDTEARRRLGVRGASVFSAPNRQALDASGYADACARNRCATERKNQAGRAISQQAYYLIQKIRQVDDVVRGNRYPQTQICEVHPELSFMALRDDGKDTGRGGLTSKHEVEGRALRLDLLRKVFGSDVDRILTDRGVRTSRQASRSDLLDAFAALWSAQRIYRNECTALQDGLAKDEYNIGMVIRF